MDQKNKENVLPHYDTSMAQSATKQRKEGQNRRKTFSVTKVIEGVMRAEAVQGILSKTL